MTKLQFFNYIKRQLGYPLLHIEIDDRLILTHGGSTGTFTVNETVTSANGASGTCLTVGTTFIEVIAVSGVFVETDSITGSSSTAIAVLSGISSDESQLDDVVNDAMDLFKEYHSDALTKQVIFLDITKDVKEYTLDDTIFSIVDILGTQNTGYLFTYDDEDQRYSYESINSYFGYEGYGYSAVDIEVFRQRHAMVSAELKRDYVFDYSYLEKKLIFNGEIETNHTVALVVNRYLDDEDMTYGSFWFRKYCVAMAGLAWAQNIGKYGGVKLPGGGEMNYGDIYAKYNELRTELNEEILERYSAPFGMFIG